MWNGVMANNDNDNQIIYYSVMKMILMTINNNGVMIMKMIQYWPMIIDENESIINGEK